MQVNKSQLGRVRSAMAERQVFGLTFDDKHAAARCMYTSRVAEDTRLCDAKVKTSIYTRSTWRWHAGRVVKGYGEGGGAAFSRGFSDPSTRSY